MPKVNTLTVHFVRDSDDSSRDDVLTVRSADDGWVTVKYHDKVSDIKNLSFMKEEGFMKYMESMLSLLQYDSAPYQSVQISAPCHPLVLISVTDLSNDDCINTIGNVLSSCWRIWYPFSARTSDVILEEDEEEDTHQFYGCHCEQE
jgi:hypothetical protein